LVLVTVLAIIALVGIASAIVLLRRRGSASATGGADDAAPDPGELPADGTVDESLPSDLGSDEAPLDPPE
jgi:hypothetical protein